MILSDLNGFYVHQELTTNQRSIEPQSVHKKGSLAQMQEDV